MRKIAITAALLGSTLIAGAALAASMDTSGVIKSIDAKSNRITLADGKVFYLPKGFDTKTLKTGEKVSIVYDMKNKHMDATSVKPAQ